jgi:hypothetical protein
MVGGVAAERRGATAALDDEQRQRHHGASRWDRSVAESGADAESFSVVVLYRWAGEVWSFSRPGVRRYRGGDEAGLPGRSL